MAMPRAARLLGRRATAGVVQARQVEPDPTHVPQLLTGRTRAAAGAAWPHADLESARQSESQDTAQAPEGPRGSLKLGVPKLPRPSLTLQGVSNAPFCPAAFETAAFSLQMPKIRLASFCPPCLETAPSRTAYLPPHLPSLTLLPPFSTLGQRCCTPAAASSPPLAPRPPPASSRAPQPGEPLRLCVQPCLQPGSPQSWFRGGGQGWAGRGPADAGG